MFVSFSARLLDIIVLLKELCQRNGTVLEKYLSPHLVYGVNMWNMVSDKQIACIRHFTNSMHACDQ